MASWTHDSEVGDYIPQSCITQLTIHYRGYLNNPKANEETFTSDHWLKTGDIVQINAEGVLWIVDRKKELVKYKGFQGK